MDSPRFLSNRGVRVYDEHEAKSFSATRVLRKEVVVCTQKHLAAADPAVEEYGVCAVIVRAFQLLPWPAHIEQHPAQSSNQLMR